MNSVISQSFGQLAQSGLHKLWQEFENIKNLIKYSESKTSKEIHRKLVIMGFFKKKKDILFEEGKPASVSALQGIIGLCAGGLSVAIMAFICEWIKYKLKTCRFEVGQIACRVGAIKCKISIFICHNISG